MLCWWDSDDDVGPSASAPATTSAETTAVPPRSGVPQPVVVPLLAATALQQLTPCKRPAPLDEQPTAVKTANRKRVRVAVAPPAATAPTVDEIELHRQQHHAEGCGVCIFATHRTRWEAEALLPGCRSTWLRPQLASLSARTPRSPQAKTATCV